MTHNFTHPQPTEKGISVVYFTAWAGWLSCNTSTQTSEKKNPLLPPNKNNHLNYNGYVSCSHSVVGRTQLRWHWPLGVLSGVWAGLWGNYRVVSRKDGAEACLHRLLSAQAANVGSQLVPFCFIFNLCMMHLG